MTLSDLSRVLGVIPVDKRLPARSEVNFRSKDGEIQQSKKIGVFEEATEECKQAYVEIRRVNDDMNEALVDALAGRYETSPRLLLRNMEVQLAYSRDLLPWRPSRPAEGDQTVPPAPGTVVRLVTFLSKKSPHAILITSGSELGKTTGRVVPVDHPANGRANVAKNKPVVIFGAVDDETCARFEEIKRINADIDELLLDVMSGRFESSPRFSNFLRNIPDHVRRFVATSVASVTVWIRGAGDLPDWRRHLRPIVNFVPKDENAPPLGRDDKSKILDSIINPVLQLFDLPRERTLGHGFATAEEDCPEWHLFPDHVQISYSKAIRWVGGKTLSNRGMVDSSVEQQQPQYPPPQRPLSMSRSSSRVDELLRRMMEISSSERRWLFEQLQREFGSGEMERRRERSGPPAAAGSAASLLIPPPLVVVDGVVIPAPMGINPLVFPPAIIFH